MNRRSFWQSLVALFAAPKIAEALSEESAGIHVLSPEECVITNCVMHGRKTWHVSNQEEFDEATRFASEGDTIYLAAGTYTATVLPRGVTMQGS